MFSGVDYENFDSADLTAKEQIRQVSKETLPAEMFEYAFVWRSAGFFTPKPYAADGYVGAAFANADNEFFEIRTYPDSPCGSSRLFTSLKSENEEMYRETVETVLSFLSAVGMRSRVSRYKKGEAYGKRRDPYDSLVSTETLFDLILREAGRALPGQVSKDEIQAVIEANWAFTDHDLEPHPRHEFSSCWLETFEMIFDMYPTGYYRGTISFDGARNITLRDKGVAYLRDHAFLF